MQIHASSVLQHPRARVFQAFRDEMPNVAAFMPNVKEIVVRSRTEEGAVTRIHNEWVGKGEIPKAAQGIVKPEMLRWDDHAEWNSQTFACAWTLKLRVFTDNVKCFGRTVLAEEGPSATRVTLTGELELDMRDIPGVPRFLAGTLAPQVEKFVVALVRPNLEQMNVSLGRYLDSRA
ncbi:MAG: hypothetical protein RLZZ299_3064 [Pseudomonadota bacterium]|jgi:hypothetical protein